MPAPADTEAGAGGRTKRQPSLCTGRSCGGRLCAAKVRALGTKPRRAKGGKKECQCCEKQESQVRVATQFETAIMAEGGESNPNPIKDGKSRSINHDLMNHNSFYGTYISATRAAIHLGVLLVHGHPFGECTGASLRKRKIGQNPKMCRSTLHLFCRTSQYFNITHLKIFEVSYQLY